MNNKGIVAIDKRTEKKNCGNNAQKLLPIKRRLNANKIQFNSSSNETLIQYENEIRAQGLNINQQEQQLNKSSNDLNFATKKEDESDRVEIRKQSNNSNVINSNITEKNCTTNSNACLV